MNKTERIAAMILLLTTVLVEDVKTYEDHKVDCNRKPGMGTRSEPEQDWLRQSQTYEAIDRKIILLREQLLELRRLL